MRGRRVFGSRVHRVRSDLAIKNVYLIPMSLACPTGHSPPLPGLPLEKSTTHANSWRPRQASLHPYFAFTGQSPW